MKYRKHDWLTIKTMEPKYGIQAKLRDLKHSKKSA